MTLNVSNLTQKSFSVITPYIVPRNLNKKVNAGDGFIFDSSIKLIGYNPKYTFSSREILNQESIDLINSTNMLVVTGANIIKDKFEIATGFNLDILNKVKVPIALMGIGHYGNIEATKNGLDESSKILMTEFINRFPLISVRCNGSYDYMINSLNHYSNNILNTSCPVIFNVDQIDKNFEKKSLYKKLIVTLTDRAFLKDQLPLLKFAPIIFKSKIKVLALHQDYNNVELQNFAKQLGYEIFISDQYQDYIDLYKESDIHIGNRVHGHLKCLSMGIPSFCTPFDMRQKFFSISIGLPLVNKTNDPSLKDFNFKNFKNHQKERFKTMRRFISKILEQIT